MSEKKEIEILERKGNLVLGEGVVCSFEKVKTSSHQSRVLFTINRQPCAVFYVARKKLRIRYHSYDVNKCAIWVPYEKGIRRLARRATHWVPQGATIAVEKHDRGFVVIKVT